MGRPRRGPNPALVLSFPTLRLALLPHPASSHGYLSSPRSRNLLASQETVWWPITENDPEPETCPHCLNRGGSLARCGVFLGPHGEERNYDSPRNALGGTMPIRVQANYTQGQDVVLDVTLTAHHKGHFVFSACPIAPHEVPAQACFDRYPLTFVRDLLHGGNYDPNHPERAYIAPVNAPGYVPDVSSTAAAMDYSFEMRLPSEVYGDLVLIQWYYLTANSCYHEGYPEYNWPTSWDIDPTSSGPCESVSPDGTGVPEQFWNCAEVRVARDPSIIIGGGSSTPAGRPPPPWASRPPGDDAGGSGGAGAEESAAWDHLGGGGAGSSAVAVAFCLAIIVLGGFAFLAFAARKRRWELRDAEECVDDSGSEAGFDSSYSTEELQNRTMDEGGAYGDDRGMYGDESNMYGDEPIYVDEDDASRGRVAGAGLELSMERMARDLGGDDGGAPTARR